MSLAGTVHHFRRADQRLWCDWIATTVAIQRFARFPPKWLGGTIACHDQTSWRNAGAPVLEISASARNVDSRTCAGSMAGHPFPKTGHRSFGAGGISLI